ncbi:MAG: glycosyltransferase, partial [Cyanobacteriota bacterium]
MMIALGILLLVLIAGSMVFYIACALCTRQFFASTQEITDTPTLGVSVMVPVCGVDAGAWDNWSSFCSQNYPEYEVLFGVTDPQDSAVPVLEKLVATYPKQARLFKGLKPRGINYKDSNLSYLLQEAQHEVIIFADSDIRVNSDYIRTVTAPLSDPEVGMVTCAFIGYNPQSIGAALASFGRCFDFIPS